MLVAAKDRTIIHDLERWYTSGKLTLVAGQALRVAEPSREIKAFPYFMA
jgi:hypothetical protein